MGGRNLFMELRPVNKDRCSHTSVSLTGDFLRSAKLRRSLAHQINHSFLVNGGTAAMIAYEANDTMVANAPVSHVAAP